MAKKKSLILLKKNLNDLALSAEHLIYSFDICKKNKNSETKDYLVQYEALTARYGRTTDILINKVLRSLDTVEFIDQGSVIDIMNRAEKRKFVKSVDELRELKDLRNDIVHSYSNDYTEIFKDVFVMVPQLLKIIEKVNKYCEKLLRDI